MPRHLLVAIGDPSRGQTPGKDVYRVGALPHTAQAGRFRGMTGKDDIMTKVRMSAKLLTYRQRMKDGLRRVIRHKFIGGIPPGERVEPPLAEEKLLPPPCIVAVTLENYRGREGDFIGIVIFHDFGIHAMHVTILDDRGGRIEGGRAIPCPDDPEIWGFLPTVRVPAGTSVMVQITAMDCMRGIGRRWIGKRMGADE